MSRSISLLRQVRPRSWEKFGFGPEQPLAYSYLRQSMGFSFEAR